MHDKCHGSPNGGAMGDAFGIMWSLLTLLRKLRAKYGEEGIAAYDKSYPWFDKHLRYHKALFSDDTQISLSTGEELIESTKRGMPSLPTI